MKGKRQLFVLSREAWDALTEEEVSATVAGMKECGIYNLPYREVDLWVPADVAVHWIETPFAASKEGETFRQHIKAGVLVKTQVFNPDTGEVIQAYRPNYGPGMWLEISRLSLDHVELTKAIVVDGDSKYFRKGKVVSDPRDQKVSERERDIFAQALIVLLNTRNAVKETERNKLAALGIGKKTGRKSYEYVTTISLPKEIEESGEGEEPRTPGKMVRPHLRRGHVRRQRFGPGLQYSKVRWIESVFVNADKDWVESRQRYNVAL